MIQQFHFWVYAPTKAGTQTDICSPIFTETMSAKAKDGSNPVFIQIYGFFKTTHRHTHTHTHRGRHLKRKALLTHTSAWMDLEDIMLREISQSQKDKCCMIPVR